jgi:hypothetical protein
MTETAKINYVNIGLMIFSALAAFMMPFEVFLMAYAILGPLHYLTEISWLHDRNYFVKGKRDVLILILVAFVMLLSLLDSKFDLHLGVDFIFSYRAMFTAFFSALVFVLVKNEWLKWLGVLMVWALSFATTKLYLFLLVFLPTLVHVFLFTAIFVLYGALKSKSISGAISFFVMVLIPVLLFYVAPGKIMIPMTQYGQSAYESFISLNKFTLATFFDYKFESPGGSSAADLNNMFHSTIGVAVQRFIAYAYTYHYLNWFSKTNIIRWHQIPKIRITFILAAWAVSIALYLYNYQLGFEWLFLLSFLHVLLEFPLNFVSMIGIGTEVKTLFAKGKLAAS